MKNVYEVLREKEAQLRKTQIEVEALRTVAPLLGEDGEQSSEGVNGGSRRAAAKR